MTSDDLDLTRSQQRLKVVLRSIPDTIHALSSVSFQPDMTTLPGESSHKSLNFDQTGVVISGLQIIFRNVFGKFMLSAIICRLRIDNRSGNFADSRGPTPPTPPTTGRVCERGPC